MRVERLEPRTLSIDMSLMRKALLARSTNPWLREQATKRAFVRRSVSRVHAGRDRSRMRSQAAATLKPQGITTILTGSART